MAANTGPSPQKEIHIQTYLQICLIPAFCPLPCSWQIVSFPSTKRNASWLAQAKSKQKGREKKKRRRGKNTAATTVLSSGQEVMISSKCLRSPRRWNPEAEWKPHSFCGRPKCKPLIVSGQAEAKGPKADSHLHRGQDWEKIQEPSSKRSWALWLFFIYCLCFKGTLQSQPLLSLATQRARHVVKRTDSPPPSSANSSTHRFKHIWPGSECSALERSHQQWNGSSRHEQTWFWSWH